MIYKLNDRKLTDKEKRCIKIGDKIVFGIDKLPDSELEGFGVVKEPEPEPIFDLIVEKVKFGNKITREYESQIEAIIKEVQKQTLMDSEFVITDELRQQALALRGLLEDKMIEIEIANEEELKALINE